MLTFIEDLGMNQDKKGRLGLFLCSNCEETHEREVYKQKRKPQEFCKKCRLNLNKPSIEVLKLRNVYTQIKQRCYNPKHKRYSSYGNRGIIVCDEWLNNKELFIEWSLNNGYEYTKTKKNELSLDRIDNNGNYEPNNCRYVTMNIQGQNTRILNSKNTSGYRGIHLKINRFVATITINKKQIHLGSFKNIIDAVICRNNFIDKNNLEHTKNTIKETT